MSLGTFIANFFRQGTAESSTRLVGIGSFFVATVLASYMVLAQRTSAGDIATLALLFTNACVALGLRKSDGTAS